MSIKVGDIAIVIDCSYVGALRSGTVSFENTREIFNKRCRVVSTNCVLPGRNGANEKVPNDTIISMLDTKCFYLIKERFLEVESKRCPECGHILEKEGC